MPAYCHDTPKIPTAGRSRQELTAGTAAGALRAGEDTALWLSGFDNPHLQEAIGWDGRTLTDRFEEALIDAGMNPTWLCGSALVGEYGTYIGTAFTGAGATRGASGVANRLLRSYADDTAQAISSGSRLAEVSRAAFRAADDPGSIFIKNKHLSSASGRQAKFDSTDIAEVQQLVANGLRSDGAVFLPNNLEGTFRVVVDMGRSIGTKGQTRIRIVATDDGRVINAFPVNVR